jgi:spermidine synthase
MLLLLLALFISGISSLTYQVLWLRLLSLVFGVTAYAASTVLASFMAGLALGSFVAGRVALRARRPLLWFGCAELMIGLSALATPTALEAIGRVYGVASGSVSEDALAMTTALRFACALAALIVPTTLMGATLPLVVASPLVRQGAIASRIGALYGTNTAGAICGAILTGFYLIGNIGIRSTFIWAAVLNALAGALALHLSRRHEPEDVATAPPTPAVPEPIVGRAGPSMRLMIVVFGLSGFAALALEVIWFRILVLFLPATTYAFTTMLATVLGGLAGGGWIAARLLRRERDWLTWLTAVQIATSLVVLGALSLLAMTYAAGWRTSGTIQASVVAILPASVLMGLAFPIGLRIAADESAGSARHAERPRPTPDGEEGARRHAFASSREIAHRLGTLYSVNVLGAILGSALAGFLFLPRLGSRTSLVLCAALYAVSGALLASAWSHRRRALLLVGASVALFALAVPAVPDPFRATLARRHGPLERVLWHDEGVQTTVAVHSSGLGGHTLYLDGLHQANDTANMLQVHRQIGHLAVMLHPAPKDVLVIGLGGGVTAGAVSQHPVSVEVVELSDGVRQAATWFSHVNYDVLRQPNVRLRVDDGRNFLTRRPGSYDVITADIIQPIHAGAGHLYSVEYFRLAHDALREDGLMLQWVGHRPRTQYELIVRTFLTAFPHTTLWADGTLLVGSKRPLVLHRQAFDRQLADPRTRAAVEWVGLTSFETLQSWFTAGPRTIHRVIGAGPILSDDRPLIEYHRSLPNESGEYDISPLRGGSEPRPDVEP